MHGETLKFKNVTVYWIIVVFVWPAIWKAHDEWKSVAKYCDLPRPVVESCGRDLL